MKDILKSKQVLALVEAYRDLERTLQQLKRANWSSSSFGSIDVKKLVDQLSKSKKQLERKIGNTLLLEKEQLQLKLNALTENLKKKIES